VHGASVRRVLTVASVVALVCSLAVAWTPTAATAAPFGQVFGFGTATDFGSPGRINLPVVGMASTPSGNGYWITAGDGGVFTFGDAGFFGSAGAIKLNRPVVGMTSTPSGNGYWFVATDGGIFSYGDAVFHGSTGNIALNKPIVGMTATPTGNGYWLVASDGGIFGFGDATFHGSMGGIPLNKPIVAMASSPTGQGYWLVASDGGIFSFGDARFFGSTGDIVLARPVVGMAPTTTGNGYWFVADDGGIFAYGDAVFHGSLGGTRLSGPVVGMARRAPDDGGYWLLDAGNVVNDVCIGDPASEDADTASHGVTDIIGICMHASPAGLTFDIAVRTPVSRAQLLTYIRDRASDTADSIFVGISVYVDNAYRNARSVEIVVDGNDTFADVYSELDNPDEVPNHVPVPLVVNGSTWTFGPVPLNALQDTSTFFFDVETSFDHAIGDGEFESFIDLAPGIEATAPVGPASP
jgi:hypothetical protein